MASPQLQHSPQSPPAEPVVDAACAGKRPVLASPCKKRARPEDDASVSPTATNALDPASPEERAISPKKKARAEADPVKWEGLSSSVDLDAASAEDDKQQTPTQSSQPTPEQYEPIALSDAPAEFSDEELRILQFFLGA